MKKNNLWLAWSIGIVLLLALVASACAPAAAPTPTPTSAPAAAATPTAPAPAVKVRFGSPGFLADAPVFVALDRGYFKEQGIEFEHQILKGTPEAIPLLAKGDMEVSSSSVTASFNNAVVRGLNIKFVADKSSEAKGFGDMAMMLRKDLADGGTVKTAADLKGKKVAISCRACAFDYALSVFLAEGKLTVDDVELVDLAVPDMMAAFGNKSIDAAPMAEPSVAQAVAKGLAVRWKGTDEIAPQMQVSGILYGETFASNTDAARRFMLAYLKGIRTYHDELVKGKNRAAIVKIMSNLTKIEEPLFERIVMPWVDPNGVLNIQSMREQLEFYKKRGAVTDVVDLSKVVDTQFMDYAVQKLGKYQ
ncbi:MAG: ABC transporter substrate-binding protein [Dehalococcoidia bacterium]|nr:ABC transporter substrate-binding protein [Dehalococcoidia bacterium]